MVNDEKRSIDQETEEPRYSLPELTDAAGVSARTVRYYIAEGLLPPPVTAGPRSHYTREHLDRLRLIDRLKASYLPLKEIRRRLTNLSDEEVRRLAEREPPPAYLPAVHPGPGVRHPTPSRPPDSAASYIARLLHRPGASDAAESRRRSPPASAEGLPDQPNLEAAAFALADQPASSPDAPSDAGRLYDAVLMSPEPESALVSWRRVPIADGAEVLIRDDLYELKRDRVEWLIGWARKVFG